jgi:hypothetical protein
MEDDPTELRTTSKSEEADIGEHLDQKGRRGTHSEAVDLCQLRSNCALLCPTPDLPAHFWTGANTSICSPGTDPVVAYVVRPHTSMSADGARWG